MMQLYYDYTPSLLNPHLGTGGGMRRYFVQTTIAHLLGEYLNYKWDSLKSKQRILVVSALLVENYQPS